LRGKRKSDISRPDPIRCSELVKKEARICRFCGYEFYPKPKTIDQEIEELDRQKKEVNEKLKEHEDDLNEEII